MSGQFESQQIVPLSFSIKLMALVAYWLSSGERFCCLKNLGSSLFFWSISIWTSQELKTSSSQITLKDEIEPLEWYSSGPLEEVLLGSWSFSPTSMLINTDEHYWLCTVGILKTQYVEWGSSRSLGGRSPTHPGSAITQLQSWHWGSLNLATLQLHLLENGEEPPSGLCKAMIYVKSLWKQHCNHLAMCHYYWWPINCKERTLIYNSLKSENSQKEINEEYRFK